MERFLEQGTHTAVSKRGCADGGEGSQNGPCPKCFRNGCMGIHRVESWNHGLSNRPCMLSTRSSIFLLLLKTRIHPHSGFDRGKRPRRGLKSASPDRRGPTRQVPTGNPSPGMTRSAAPPPAVSESAGLKRIPTTRGERARAGHGRGAVRWARGLGAGVVARLPACRKRIRGVLA